jgi:hypothetical protein
MSVALLAGMALLIKKNMRHIVLLVGIAALAFVVGCANPAKPPVRVENTAPPARTAPEAEQHDDGHDAPRITLAEAKKDYDAGTAVIIDVRSEEAYKQEHIKGAINLTKGVLDEQLNKIPKGKKIVAYCS